MKLTCTRPSLKLIHLAIFSALLVSSQAFAQSEEEEFALAYGDEDFISIATGRSQLISKAPAVASIITAEQIEQSGARSIDDVLEMVPGLHVWRRCCRCSGISC